MDVAISGDRGCCLTRELAPGTYLFAVANGFGVVDGEPIAPAALRRLRQEFERRLHPKRISNALSAALTRVNTALHLRSASHEDYVTAGCSITAVLVVHDRAYLAHVGSTAAYLARDGYVVALTTTDAFDAERVAVLTRALAVQPNVDVASCNFGLSDGDALVLAGRALREADDRRRLAERLAYGAQGVPGDEQLLIVRYESAEDSIPGAVDCAAPGRPFVVGVIATILFYAMLCLR